MIFLDDLLQDLLIKWLLEIEKNFNSSPPVMSLAPVKPLKRTGAFFFDVNFDYSY